MTATLTQQLPTLRLCTAGSVDDGKSTFVGRLLHDTKSILADQYESVERASTAKGLENPDLSLLVDGLRAEREQGITIDVAYRYFATDKRSFILADTPGHVQYTRNTVTGLSTSELVIVLVDARNGVIEQTRRHLQVAAMMKISQVIVAVNKIDAVDYSEEVFNNVKRDVEALVEELGLAHVDVIPTSALLGDNVVERSSNTPWYTGPSVLELLETAQPAQYSQDVQRGLRFPVQIVIRDHATDYRGYAGRVAAGQVSRGDVVRAGGLEAVIEGIDGPQGEQETATRGESVTLRLDRDIDLSRGDLIAAGADVPAPQQTFEATVFHLSETPVQVRGNVLIRYGSALVRGRVDSIDGDRTQLQLNDIATVRITVAEPLPVEPYRRSGKVGSLLIVHPQTGDTLTAGLVK
ncbi:sulfate adenylyltransferase subunit 1 [Corynebacterium falsenii]|uniref:sulfate adenylyltransferase subunit 1 n=1 Tax=Corynebacterium falsenii TaxID=108486 RepID=UPI0003E92DAF|nr:GTP-binding protein [Corynebacterium falsenii]AHI02455.1 sulfate adenylate transferase [Corynebacterium falsenii DSM 44353]UBI05233.1 GTP-binding protein [Corynebacterium falsenii]UBI06789.1 GTP-binding protein [Corynebacterium falsenii]HJF11803.1 GTP-binding protein [Corynebacterium falsenii]